jgi:putative heme transporter
MLLSIEIMITFPLTPPISPHSSLLSSVLTPHSSLQSSLLNPQSSKLRPLPTILVTIVFGYLVLVTGKPIIMPVVVAAFIATIINPLVVRLENWKINRMVATIAILVTGLMFIPLFVFVVFKQGEAIAADLPEITGKLNTWYQGIILFLDQQLGINAVEQAEYIQQGIERLFSSSGALIQGTMNATANMLAYFALMPIYIFFMILYKERFSDFLIAMHEPDERNRVDDMIEKVEGVVQNYVAGLALVVAIMAVLNVTGLLLLGIPYAVFFGILAALLAIIPYVGVLVGAVPPLLIALLMTDSLFYPAGVIVLFVIVQTLEGNVITPKIIGEKVSVNALAAILALVVGGFLWGAVGMILSIPLLGVAKVVLKTTKGGRPWAELMG